MSTIVVLRLQTLCKIEGYISFNQETTSQGSLFLSKYIIGDLCSIMPWHIKKESILGSAIPTGGVEYYTGDNAWSNDYSKRKVYSNQADADAQKNTTVTTSLGITYQPKWWANATVVSE